MTADASGAMCEIRPSRRVFGHLALGAAVALRAPRQASAEFPKISSIKQKDIDEWTELDDGSGLRLYDVYEGLGSNTKNGDRMRLRYTVYLLDGTVVSRGQGVEQEFTLGKKQVPLGLENGVRDMKAGAERMLYIPPEIGWSSKYRASAVQQIKTCGLSTCPLDNQALIVYSKLEGYVKGECKGGDTPLSAIKVDMSKGTASVTIGSEACPEGPVEVTEKRLKTMDMINQMKSSGKLKAAEKQKFVIP